MKAPSVSIHKIILKQFEKVEDFIVSIHKPLLYGNKSHYSTFRFSSNATRACYEGSRRVSWQRASQLPCIDRRPGSRHRICGPMSGSANRRTRQVSGQQPPSRASHAGVYVQIAATSRSYYSGRSAAWQMCWQASKQVLSVKSKGGRQA